MKKIRRTRIRTETSKLVFIQEQTGRIDEQPLDAHEICPACGQRIVPAVKNITALPLACAVMHDESNREGIIELKKQEK